MSSLSQPNNLPLVLEVPPEVDDTFIGFINGDSSFLTSNIKFSTRVDGSDVSESGRFDIVAYLVTCDKPKKYYLLTPHLSLPANASTLTNNASLIDTHTSYRHNISGSTFYLVIRPSKFGSFYSDP